MLKTKLTLMAAALVCASASWAASPHVETAGFTLDVTEDSSIGFQTSDVTLLSDSGNVAKIGLTGLANWGNFGLDTRYQRQNSNGDLADARLDFGVRAGYQITGVALSVSYSGHLSPGQMPEEEGNYISIEGDAHNRSVLSLSLGAWRYGNAFGSNSASVSDLNGVQTVSFAKVNNAALTHDFVASLGMNFFVEATTTQWATSFPWWDHDPIYHDAISKADLQMLNPMLTITYAAAVPEPETYGMLLGGLALLATLARRRKRA